MVSRLQIRHLYPVLPLALYAVIVAEPLGDNSFFWHVRAGAVQLASGRVLTRDPFSYMAGGERWRTQSWLVELLYGRLEWMFGSVAWAPLMVAAVTIGTLSLCGLVTYRYVHSTFSTGVWLFVLGWLLVPFGVPRPVVFSYLLLAMLVMVLALDDRARWAVVPIIWVWAGVHGSWVIGLGLVLLMAISRRSVRTATVGVAAAAATLATAHGLGTWGIVMSFARNSTALEYMAEWGTPDFSSIVQAPYLVILVGLIVAAVRGRMTMADLWVVVPFMLLGFSSNRTVPVAALVLIPFAARSVRVSLPLSARRFHVIPWVVLSMALAVAVFMHAKNPFEFDAEMFPSDAAIAAVGSGRFFHDDAVGGYLIYREGPERLVYIDDRVELYGATRFAEFLDARDGDYRTVFERYGMSTALVRSEWPLRMALLKDGWRITYEDSTFSVLAEDGH
jgi:hypothetical protein